MSFQNDTVKIQRALLDEALTKGIQRNEERCKVWTEYKKNHREVAEALQSFQKDLYVNCMVPIGKRALVKGKLIHTNEVLACLGDGYFGKYSTAGATSLCERRIKKAEEMLENLNAERNLFETRLMVTTNDLLEDFGGSEIVEHWNDDQIADWKRKHRERERDYHQKLAKLKQEERKKIETEEDLFNRLDQLEIEEELADEFNRLEDEKYEYFGEELEDEEEEEYYDDSESEAETKEEEEEDTRKEDDPIPDSNTESPEKSPDSCKIKKSVSFAEPGDILKKSEDNSAQKETECSENQEDIFRIEFSHSENNPVIKSDGDSIESPADICSIFTKPKSILKRSPNDVNPERGMPLRYSWVDEEDEEEEEQEDEETIKPSAYETVVKDIKERSLALVAKEDRSKRQSVNVGEMKDTRLVSKFEKDRQLRRKQFV